MRKKYCASKKNYKSFFIFFCFFCYLLYTFSVAYSIPCNSDMANMVLEAEDIIHGNLFLRDWILTGITFFTTDLIFFEIGTAFFGISNFAYVFSIWLMWLSLIAAGCLFFFDLCPKEKRWYLLPLFLTICAFPCKEFIMHSRVHTGSAFFALLGIFFARKAAATERKIHFILCGLSLVFATAGDISGLLTGILPIVLVFSVKSYRSIVSEGKTIKNKYSIIVAVVVAAFICAIILEKLWLFLGGADKNAYIGEKSFLPISEWQNHLTIYFDGLFSLVDAHFMGEHIGSFQTLIALFRSSIIIAGLCTMFFHILKFLRNQTHDETIVLLSTSFCAISAVYILTSLSINIWTTRYFAYTPVIFALVISRQVVTLQKIPMNKKAVRSICAFCSLFLICASVLHNGSNIRIFFDKQSRSKIGKDSERLELANFLTAQGLSNGYATFWDASILTVYSKNKVKVRHLNADGTQMKWFCKNTWYSEPANFIIANGIDQNEIARRFGDRKSVV